MATNFIDSSGNDLEIVFEPKGGLSGNAATGFQNSTSVDMATIFADVSEGSAQTYNTKLESNGVDLRYHFAANGSVTYETVTLSGGTRVGIDTNPTIFATSAFFTFGANSYVVGTSRSGGGYTNTAEATSTDIIIPHRTVSAGEYYVNCHVLAISSAGWSTYEAGGTAAVNTWIDLSTSPKWGLEYESATAYDTTLVCNVMISTTQSEAGLLDWGLYDMNILGGGTPPPDVDF